LIEIVPVSGIMMSWTNPGLMSYLEDNYWVHPVNELADANDFSLFPAPLVNAGA